MAALVAAVEVAAVRTVLAFVEAAAVSAVLLLVAELQSVVGNLASLPVAWTAPAPPPCPDRTSSGAEGRRGGRELERRKEAAASLPQTGTPRGGACP